MIWTTELIRIVATHRGIGIHDGQSASRIELVKAEIDQVLELRELDALFAFALAGERAPEARLLAAALVEARWRLAAEERRARPQNVDLEVLHASTAALGTEYWRDPWRYGTLLCEGAVKREVPLENR